MTDKTADDLATRLTAIAEGAGGSITPPIVQTSLFAFDSFDDFKARMDGSSDAPMYTRVQNPTVAAFEAMMALTLALPWWVSRHGVIAGPTVTV